MRKESFNGPPWPGSRVPDGAAEVFRGRSVPEPDAVATTPLHPVADEEGTTAFVLGGGGSLGAVQVGMLRALLELGIRPDFVVGTSIGSLNGAYLAGHLDLDGVESLARPMVHGASGRRFPHQCT